MVNKIFKKNILFICPFFHDYPQIIKNALLELGANEVYLEPLKLHGETRRESPSSSVLLTIIKWLKNPLYRRNWTQKVINNIENKQVDILFCIGGYPYTKSLINILKNKNPYLASYLFLWDSLSFYDYSEYVSLFDYAFSFDKDDCAKINELEYLPDFYIKHNDLHQKKIYDFTYIGTINNMNFEERYNCLRKISEQLNSNRWHCYLHAYIPQLKYSTKTYIQEIFNPLHRRYRKFIGCISNSNFTSTKHLSIDDVIQIQSQSKCIIDISYGNRQGLTMHCIDAIANGIKLITTNEHIKHEPFYHPNNILIIDKENPIIDMEFLDKPVIPVDIKYLRLDNWLKYIINR